MAQKQLIIPVFLPFAGCRHQCVFCDQFGITTNSPSDAHAVCRTIDEHLACGKAGTEIAFYGGSFTTLPPECQSYLEIAYEYVLSEPLTP